MLRFAATFALLVAAASATAVSITPTIRSSPKLSLVKGAVGGISNCGSQGQILEVRVTDCNSLPCEAIIGKTYTVEVDFIPVSSHTTLNVYVGLVTNGQEIEVIKQDVAVTIVAGKGYTIEFPWKVQGGLANGIAVIRIRLTDGAIVELCGLATVNIHA